ncbi:hypothetical protein ACES2L_05965 [Bdellovibrio bacteriovorus]
MADKKQSAFPVSSDAGLSKKEYYAAAALQGLLSNDKYMDSIKNVGAKVLNSEEIATKVAGFANLIADKMINEIK